MTELLAKTIEKFAVAKEVFLEETFGEGGHTEVKFTFCDIRREATLLSARGIRIRRFKRFVCATGFGLLGVHMVSQILGYQWDPYDGVGEVVLAVILLVNFFAQAVKAELDLRIDRINRGGCQYLADFMDDFIEDNPDILDETNRTRMRSTVIDYAVHAQDPCKWDKPWWRLKDPLRG